MSETKKQPKIIAVDFDGTLAGNAYPGIGEPRTDILQYCIDQKTAGAQIILWTNRVGDKLDEAVEWCRQHGLTFDAVNDNLPQMVEFFGSNSRKIFANEYIDDRMCTKFRFGKPKGKFSEWAAHEVELACAGYLEEKPMHWEHQIANLKAALRAILAAFDDRLDDEYVEGAIVRDIINRLMWKDCLMPIVDTPDIWGEPETYGPDDTTKHYQCKRRTCLFKDVDKDENVTYDDVDRIKTYDVNDEHQIPWSNGVVNNLINELYPLEMPYIPSADEIKVYCELFTTDISKKEFQESGAYDTLGILYLEWTSGERVELNRYFKDDDAHWTMVPIDKEEYEARKARKIQKDLTDKGRRLDLEVKVEPSEEA